MAGAALGAGFSRRLQAGVGLDAGCGPGFQVVDVAQGEPDDLVKRRGGRAFAQLPVAFLAEAVLRRARYYARVVGDSLSGLLPGLRSRSQIVSWTRDEMRSLA